MSPNNGPRADVTLPRVSEIEGTPRNRTGRERLNIFLQYKEATALVILVALCVLLAIVDKNFVSERSLTLVARQLSFVGVASLGAMLVLSCGQLDLSVGSCMGLGGILAAHCSVDLHLSDATSLTVALLAGLVYGACNGALVVGLRLNSLIVTLGTGLIGRGTIYSITNSMPVNGISHGLRYLGIGYLWGLPVPVWIMLVLGVIFAIYMARSTFGAHIYAIGGNEEAARLSGVPVDRLKLVSFAVAGLTGALGGVLLTARLGSGEVSVGSGYELDVIAAAVIGGLRFGVGSAGVTPVGMLLGVAVMSVMRSALSLLDIPSAFQPVVLGCAILLAMGLERMRSARRK
jgi:ribose/xylose/arabinose/galactoside ABC-type transport system permease subunit